MKRTIRQEKERLEKELEQIIEIIEANGYEYTYDSEYSEYQFDNSKECLSFYDKGCGFNDDDKKRLNNLLRLTTKIKNTFSFLF